MNIKDKNLYYIGGVVRDEILDTKSFDIDLTYDGDAIEFAKTIKNAQILQINKPFGTVRIKLDDEEIDIASTRSEIYPKKGHLPLIKEIGCSLKEDVLRRDFTINALAKSTLTGEIIDYIDGLKDIKNKTLRVLHDESFIDDPTRIVRALKFSVRFGFKLDENTEKLMKNYLENINYDMSYKRLKKELIETFNLNSWNAFELFINNKIYKLVSDKYFKLPEYNFEKLITKYKPENIWIIYVGLLPDISTLPLTKIEIKIKNSFEYLKSLNLKKDLSDFEIYKLFENIPIESVIMYSTINNKIVEKFFSDLRSIRIMITGTDLKEMNIPASKKYQKCFDYILARKIETPSLTKQDELQLAREFFN